MRRYIVENEVSGQVIYKADYDSLRDAVEDGMIWCTSGRYGRYTVTIRRNTGYGGPVLFTMNKSNIVHFPEYYRELVAQYETN